MTDETEDTIDEHDQLLQSRAIALTNQFTNELGEYCDAHVSPLLSNAEYAASCSSLLIALSRQLGRCAAAFGKANMQSEEDVRTLVFRMFNKNYDIAMAAIGAEGETVQ
jgi:hypothetical protein